MVNNTKSDVSIIIEAETARFQKNLNKALGTVENFEKKAKNPEEEIAQSLIDIIKKAETMNISAEDALRRYIS